VSLDDFIWLVRAALGVDVEFWPKTGLPMRSIWYIDINTDVPRQSERLTADKLDHNYLYGKRRLYASKRRWIKRRKASKGKRL